MARSKVGKALSAMWAKAAKPAARSYAAPPGIGHNQKPRKRKLSGEGYANLAGGPVKSSAIRAVEYNKDTRELHVTFHKGSKYAYSGVSPQRVAAFNAAGSKGRYFTKGIRNNYSYKRIG